MPTERTCHAMRAEYLPLSRCIDAVQSILSCVVGVDRVHSTTLVSCQLHNDNNNNANKTAFRPCLYQCDVLCAGKNKMWIIKRDSKHEC